MTVYYLIPTMVTDFDGETIKFTTGGTEVTHAAEWADTKVIEPGLCVPKDPVVGEPATLALAKAYCTAQGIPTYGRLKVPAVGGAPAKYHCVEVVAKSLKVQVEVKVDGKKKKVTLDLLDPSVARNGQALVIDQSGKLKLCLSPAGKKAAGKLGRDKPGLKCCD